MLSAHDVNQLEPNVTSLGALWSPTTGILDSHSFMLSLLADAEHHGATLVLHTKVQGGAVEKGNLLLRVDGMDLQCDTLINSAGLWASEIAMQLHSTGTSSTTWKPPRQYFCKGNYFRLQGCSRPPFSRLVYPVPESNGLGVHATIDYSGTSTKFGPDVEWLDVDTRPDEIDLVPSAARADVFYDQVRKYWPDLADDALVPDYAGIRPKLNYPGVHNGFVDFRIDGPSSHNIPGLYHLFGMESPGLTSSIAIGEHIGNLVDGKALAD
jgi:L-2-hydroxyglutarate oxidase LhgO